MDLLGLLKRFVQSTGHEECVADAENGDWSEPSDERIMSAKSLINNAVRFLNKHLEYHKTDAILFKRVYAGVATVEFQKARWVKEVWVVDDDGNRRQLERLSMNKLKSLYAEASLSSIERGTPAYYCANVSVFANAITWAEAFVMLPGVDGFGYSPGQPIAMVVTGGHGLVTGDVIRLSGMTDGPVELNDRTFAVTVSDANNFTLDNTNASDIENAVADIQPTVEIQTGIPNGTEDTWMMQWDKQESFLSKSLIIVPPPERTTTIEVLAAWKSDLLEEETDFNWWSLEEPELVVRTAKMYLERDLHRNQSGDAHMLQAIQMELQLLHHEMVFEEEQGMPEQFRMEYPIL
jgi:hypothetical protein